MPPPRPSTLTRLIAAHLAASLALLLLCPGWARAQEHLNSLGMSFARIPKGSFILGTDPREDPRAKLDEIPAHMVNITKSFYLGKYEVTQGEWEALMGANPSRFKAPGNPVENVSYEDALKFVEKLNRKEGTARYRLPTEAEWTYAAKAGTTGIYPFGNDPREIGAYAWFKGNSSLRPHPVGQKKPNQWGLYDMLGNVWEWVSDYYSPDYYRTGPNASPRGPQTGSLRVIRGGAFDKTPEFLRPQNRTMDRPTLTNGSLGFRVAFTAPEKKLSLFSAEKK